MMFGQTNQEIIAQNQGPIDQAADPLEPRVGEPVPRTQNPETMSELGTSYLDRESNPVVQVNESGQVVIDVGRQELLRYKVAQQWRKRLGR